MTLPIALPVMTLLVAPVQTVQTASAPPQIVQPVTVPVDGAPAQDAPQSAAPELRDALDDPASAPVGSQQIEITARGHHAKGDPLEGFNRSMFGVHQRLDKAVYRPAAMGYKHVVPKPVRSGLRNFFINLTEPIVFVNYLLQLKPGKAVKTLARFTLNSTVGLGGFVDVAKTPSFKLPHHANSFGDTLARYGVGPGPYVFLPFVGPSTLRDLLGGPADGAVLPVVVGKPFTRFEFQASSAILMGLDLRAESDVELRTLFSGAVDPYATLRSVYLQNRAAEVEELRHPRHATQAVGELEDPLADPASGTAPAPAPASDAPELRDPLADPAAPAPTTPTP